MGTVGNGILSTIAVDNVAVYAGSCSDRVNAAQSALNIAEAAGTAIHSVISMGVVTGSLAASRS